MTATSESEQLHMSVQVNPFQSWTIALKKNLREFQYSPFVQLLGQVFVWIQVGVLVGVGYILSRLSTPLHSAWGVLFPGAAFSEIDALLVRSLHPLTSSIDVYYGMCALALVSWILCLPLFALGKQGVVPFVLFFALVLMLLGTKIIFTPLFLLGV